MPEPQSQPIHQLDETVNVTGILPTEIVIRFANDGSSYTLAEFRIGALEVALDPSGEVVMQQSRSAALRDLSDVPQPLLNAINAIRDVGVIFLELQNDDITFVTP